MKGKDPIKIDEVPIEAIDVNLVVAGEKDGQVGLSITLNPKRNKEIGCLLVSSQLPEVTSEGPLQGRNLLFLHVPKIALLTVDPGAKLPATPPDSYEPLVAFWEKIGWKDTRWQLRPRTTLFYNEKYSQSDQSSSVLAVDFGTSCSTAALLNVRDSTDLSNSPVGLVMSPIPWTHVTHFPDHSTRLSPGHINATPNRFSDPEELWDSVVPAAPGHVCSSRVPWRASNSAKVRSLIYALGSEANEHVTSDGPNAIGNEAENAFENNLHLKGVKYWDQFLFGPKKKLGQDGSCLKDRSAHPIEIYLSELFDQIMHTRLIESPRSLIAPMNRICFSYPVTWTREQRTQYQRHLENALKASFMSELLPPDGTASVFNENYAVDEASAAFLGFLLERFDGVNGDELVDIFQPFSPEGSNSDSPRKIHVLVYDCGEGTTDIVLLEITDSGDEGQPVDSHVLRHFAMEKAGLEVTRRIAERLKEHLALANPGRREDLRTNLDKQEGLDDYHQANLNETMSKEAYRRSLIYLLLTEAERLKIKLARKDTQINWSEICSFTGLGEPDARTLTTKELTGIVEEVFAPAIQQIANWFREEQELDVDLKLDQNLGLDVVLMSGRSSQLPGLQQFLYSALPSSACPFEMDFVRPGNFRLDSVSEDCDEASKTAVCEGLALNFWNLASGPISRALKSHPIDERRRTRAIGVLALSPKALRVMPVFDGRFPLLVKADNKLIDPEAVLPEIRSTNPHSAGFYLGMNFGGLASPDSQLTVDAPQPFCHVRIEGGNESTHKELIFRFSQKSATEIRLKQVELIGVDGTPQTKELPITSSISTKLDFGKLKISIEPFRVDEDFRSTGRIHVGATPIDHDR
ncbi:MAG: hypothetical protein R3C03_22210 [Pirellulaceae bacterium]